MVGNGRASWREKKKVWTFWARSRIKEGCQVPSSGYSVSMLCEITYYPSFKHPFYNIITFPLSSTVEHD